MLGEALSGTATEQTDGGGPRDKKQRKVEEESTKIEFKALQPEYFSRYTVINI